MAAHGAHLLTGARLGGANVGEFSLAAFTARMLEGYPQRSEEGLPQSPPQPCWEITRSKAIFHIPFPSPAGNKVLSAGGGAVELAEESKRHRRSFLPAALRGALGKALLASPRKTSWTEAHSAAAERSLSPVQNSELCLTARYFRPRINSRCEPGCSPSQGRKWRGLFSPSSEASSAGGSLCPARKTLALHWFLSTKQAPFVDRWR